MHLVKDEFFSLQFLGHNRPGESVRRQNLIRWHDEKATILRLPRSRQRHLVASRLESVLESSAHSYILVND